MDIAAMLRYMLLRKRHKRLRQRSRLLFTFDGVG